MAVNRARIVDENFQSFVQNLSESPGRDLDLPLHRDTRLSGRLGLALFASQLVARHLDIAAREMRARGASFYTIGSAGHEGNVVLGELLRESDPCFLHYRSGAFMVRRAYRVPGETPIFDILLSLSASVDDPVSGGRHKVFGAKRLFVPPQTSTIASHLPKAVGAAVSLSRAHHLQIPCPAPPEAIVCVSFGDASLNHSTALGAINAALWAAHQNLPVPVLFVCEDNGIGISTRTPTGWVARQYAARPGLAYFYADGLDLAQAYDAARAAVAHCRQKRAPTFLHLRTVRLLGHAGSDVETGYRSLQEIEEAETRDPLCTSARLLVEAGAATPSQLLSLYEEIRERVFWASQEASRRPRLMSAEEIMAPLAPYSPGAVQQEAGRADYEEARRRVFGERLPEHEERPRHMAVLLNSALSDLLAKYPEAILFGEDVAEKGGVYHVTAGLKKRFGVGRVFNTLLDEQSILGLGIGAAHLGFLPLPEIQYLAYYHNAEDQIRGEACSLSYFSNGQFQNGMVIRIASFAYQKGFGGHFHNDNSIAVLRDVPGLVIAAPARGDDAVGMLRTALALARIDGRVVAFLEPIALYMTRDLHADGDGGWLCRYPAPREAVPLGEARLYQEGEGGDLTILSYANGAYLSLRAARRLSREHGVFARVLDLRWLAPLDRAAIAEAARATGKVLLVDEGRRTGGVSEALSALLIEEGLGHLQIDILAGEDTYIPLGDAALKVLPSEEEIVARALRLLENPARRLAEGSR